MFFTASSCRISEAGAAGGAFDDHPHRIGVLRRVLPGGMLRAPSISDSLRPPVFPPMHSQKLRLGGDRWRRNRMARRFYAVLAAMIDS
jgi:hypothetical protein